MGLTFLKLHFAWLDPADDKPGAKIFDYPDLFRDVAKSLLEAGLHSEAIKFYEPLQQIEEYFDDSCRQDLNACYAVLRSFSYNEATLPDFSIYEEFATGSPLNAMPQQFQPSSVFDGGHGQEQTGPYPVSELSTGMLAPVTPRRKTTGPKKPRPRNVMPEVEDLDRLCSRWRDLRLLLSQGIPQSRNSWLLISQKLIDIFRRQKIFFPSERSKFVGYWYGAVGYAKRMRQASEANLAPDLPLGMNRTFLVRTECLRRQRIYQWRNLKFLMISVESPSRNGWTSSSSIAWNWREMGDSMRLTMYWGQLVMRTSFESHLHRFYSFMSAGSVSDLNVASLFFFVG